MKLWRKKGVQQNNVLIPWGVNKIFFWFPKGIEILLIKIYYSQLQGWCLLGGGGIAGVLLKGGRYGVRALGGIHNRGRIIIWYGRRVIGWNESLIFVPF